MASPTRCATRNSSPVPPRGTAAGFADYAATRDALSLPLFEVTDAIAGFGWDIDGVKVLHQALNKAMKLEVEHLLSLGGDGGNGGAPAATEPLAARSAPEKEEAVS